MLQEEGEIMKAVPSHGRWGKPEHDPGNSMLRQAFIIVLLLLFITISGSTRAIEVRMSISINGLQHSGLAGQHAAKPGRDSVNPAHVEIIRTQPFAIAVASETAMLHSADMTASAHQNLVAELEDCLQQLPSAYRQRHESRLLAAWQASVGTAGDDCVAKLQLLRQWERLNHRLC